jgi:DNA replication protein DnaC
MRKRIEVAIPMGFRHARFRALPDGLRRALLTRRQGQGLLLWGPVGTGKTFAVAALVRAAVLQTRGECRIERTVYDRLILDLRDCFKPGATKSELDVLRPYLNADVLWLDDLAASESLAGAATDFQTRTIQTLLNDRLERNLATVCTSNLSPESLRRVFDERIASRLHAFKIIELRGKDRRIARANKSTSGSGK